MLNQQRSVWQAYQRPKEWPVGWKNISGVSAKKLGFLDRSFNKSALLSSVCDSWTCSDLGMALSIAHKNQMPEALFFSLTFPWRIRSVFSPWEFPELNQFQIWQLGTEKSPVIETGKGPSSSMAHKFTWANKSHKSSSVPKGCCCRNMALNKAWLPSSDYNYFHFSLYPLNAMGHGNVSASRAVKSEFFQFIFTESFSLEKPFKTIKSNHSPNTAKGHWPMSPSATSTGF